MLLTIDVGNTNIVFGLYDSEILIKKWRMGVSDKTSDEMGLFICSLFNYNDIDKSNLKGIIISSVVPSIMYSLTNGILKYFNIEPIVVNYSMNLGNVFKNSDRAGLGSDRIVNCIAAYEFFKSAAIIIDYGTATTYDAIDKNGGFITGLTAPGIKIAAEALFSRAALLGKVELNLPSSIFVKNTAESVQAGILYSAIGETEYIVNKMRIEIGEPNAKIIATGGLVHTISGGTQIFDHIVPSLTLDGLRILYKMNNR